MQESMMIAEVGDMPKVSGSRMATPLAPPSPGSTPMITPSRMPTIISPMFCHCRTTAKPWNRLPMSSMSEAQQVFQWPLGQRHQEPLFEGQVSEDHQSHREWHGGLR